MRVAFRVGNQRASARWTSTARWESYKGIVHGGIISSLLDEAMSKAILCGGDQAFTADLTNSIPQEGERRRTSLRPRMGGRNREKKDTGRSQPCLRRRRRARPCLGHISSRFPRLSLVPKFSVRRLPGTPLCRIHERVANHVAHNEVQVLNPPHMRMTDADIQICHRSQLPAISTRQGHRPASHLARACGRRQHIRRVSRTADAQQQVARQGKILQLLGKHALIADIVRVGRKRRKRVGKSMDLESPSPVRNWPLSPCR